MWRERKRWHTCKTLFMIYSVWPGSCRGTLIHTSLTFMCGLSIDNIRFAFPEPCIAVFSALMTGEVLVECCVRMPWHAALKLSVMFMSLWSEWELMSYCL